MPARAHADTSAEWLWEATPELTLTYAGWEEMFMRWIDRGDPQSLLEANIFFDFRALWGEAALDPGASQLLGQPDIASAILDHLGPRLGAAVVNVDPELEAVMLDLAAKPKQRRQIVQLVADEAHLAGSSVEVDVRRGWRERHVQQRELPEQEEGAPAHAAVQHARA